MVRRQHALTLCFIILLAGCATQTRNAVSPSTTAERIPAQPLLAPMLACLASQQTLSGAERQQRLNANGAHAAPTAAERFNHACLLGHAQASDAEISQAQEIIQSLRNDPEFAMQEQQHLLAIYARKLELMQALRLQVRESWQYRQKIEELKGLEEELEPALAAPTIDSPENGL